MSEYCYIGDELDLFSRANNWKSYWCRQIFPFLRGEVLEVGAGLGANTQLLFNDNCTGWVCLEPDSRLVNELKDNLRLKLNSAKIEIVNGTVSDLPDSASFDSIIYIDVLEHIEKDSQEMLQAMARLREGGHLIVLSPAHQMLFSAFDARIGHFRRYSKATLKSVVPDSLKLRRLRYLDSCGMLASLANRLMLHQGLPNLKQIAFWDRTLVPLSILTDKCLGYSLGKTVLGVWQKSS